MRFKPLICDLSFLEMMRARLLFAFQACTWQEQVLCFDVFSKFHVIAVCNRVTVQCCSEGIVGSNVGDKRFSNGNCGLKDCYLPMSFFVNTFLKVYNCSTIKFFFGFSTHRTVLIYV